MEKIAANDLNIENYSLKELMELFQLNYDMTTTDLLRCKRQVAALHPDKSPLLSPAYFIFYKKALDRVVELFKTLNKSERSAPAEGDKMVYRADDFDGPAVDKKHMVVGKTKATVGATAAATTVSLSSSSSGKLRGEEFQRKFNELFEESISSQKKAAEDAVRDRTAWFRADAPSDWEQGIHEIGKPTGGAAGIAASLEKLRQKYAVVKHRGDNFGEARSTAGGRSFFADMDASTDVDVDEDGYVGSDVFGRLQFDDLNRVHRDQTICPVSDADFDRRMGRGMPKNVDELRRQREDTTDLFLQSHDQKVRNAAWEAEKERREKMLMDRHFEARQVSDRYEKQNEKVRSYFMRLNDA